MNIGDIVQCFHQGTWRKARLIQHKPYYRRSGTIDGYYITWIEGIQTDPITGFTPSQGGWIQTKNIKINHLKPKIPSILTDFLMPIPKPCPIPKLFLIALENGQKVAAICIDDMSNEKFLKTIECQELMGRTWEFEVEEADG